MYAVLINEGPLSAEDNAILFCDEKPRWMAVDVEIEDTPDTMKFLMLLVFTPTNGPQKGTPMRVPRERVVSISGP